MTATATARRNRRQQQEQEAALRARLARHRRRRRQLVGGTIAAVLVAVAAMLGVAAVTGSGGSATNGPAASSGEADGTAIARMLAETPAETISAVGLGTVRALPTAVQDQPLTSGGKPQVLYLGADYCPYCAAERWGLVLALSRFGTFSHIGLTASAHDDVFPDTNTFTFHDVAYSSDYISFVGRELYSNIATSRGHYEPLDKATDAETALLTKYGGSFPLIDIAGRYVQRGASYDPAVVHGLSADSIAMTVADPQSPVSQGVAGTANALTAAICATTGGKPAAVCTDPAVTAATEKLHG